MLLILDATVLRWFPPLRSVWAFRGEQAAVRITGRNAKRVLFGAINPRRRSNGNATEPAEPRLLCRVADWPRFVLGPEVCTLSGGG